MKKFIVLSVVVLCFMSCGDSDPKGKMPTVYMAGNGHAGGILTAQYWKDEVVTYLDDGVYDTYASDILVSGTDIYVCGRQETYDNTYVAKYWKNNEVYTLTSDVYHGDATAIALMGDDVYVLTTEQNFVNQRSVIKLFKNGVLDATSDI